MNPWFLQQVNDTERENILSKHKELYNGYQTMQPKVENTQPLYVQDFAKDKLGVTVNTKGEYVPYTNKINEQFDQHMTEEKEMCSECGGMMQEGECSECGWKGEMDEETGHLDDIYKVRDLNLKKGDFDYVEGGGNDYGTFEKMHHMKEEKDVCNECGGMMQEGECSECGWKNEMEEGKLQDLKDKVLDWMDEEGETKLEKAIKKLGDFLADVEDRIDGIDTKGKKEKETKEMELPIGKISSIGSMEETTATSNAPMGKHYDEIEEPYTFNSNGPVGDGGTLRQKSIKEGGFTGGGNAPDMDLDNVDPAYDFESDGPEEDTYTEPAPDMDLDTDKEWDAYDFVSGGGNENGGDVYPVYEDMKSAWEDDESELDEVDVSGSQGIYGDMKKAYNFQSTGAGKAGPYQTSNWSEGEDEESGYEGEDEDVYWEKDLEPGELDLDLTKFNPEDKSWEEIKAHTGDWDEIDEDITESFQKQVGKINEMFNRFKRYN